MYGQCIHTKNKEDNMSCGCGRSPTGRCIGWHSLTESEYRVKLEEYNKRQALKEKKDA